MEGPLVGPPTTHDLLGDLAGSCLPQACSHHQMGDTVRGEVNFRGNETQSSRLSVS